MNKVQIQACANAKLVGVCDGRPQRQADGRPLEAHGWPLLGEVYRSADVLSGRHFVRTDLCDIFFRRTGLDVLSGRRFVRTVLHVVISWAYLGHIFGIFQACRGHISCISWAYLDHILGISLAYLGHISGISRAYLGHILGISRAYLVHISDISQAYLEHISGIS